MNSPSSNVRKYCKIKEHIEIKPNISNNNQNACMIKNPISDTKDCRKVENWTGWEKNAAQ